MSGSGGDSGRMARPLLEAEWTNGGAWPRSGWTDFSEDGLAQVYAKLRAGRLLFDSSAKTWFMWDDTRWIRDDRDIVFADIRNFVRVIRLALPDPPPGMGRISFASALLRACRSDPRLAVTRDVWD